MQLVSRAWMVSAVLVHLLFCFDRFVFLPSWCLRRYLLLRDSSTFCGNFFLIRPNEVGFYVFVCLLNHVMFIVYVGDT